MRTLELLQGAWKSMVTDLETIKHLIDNDTENIPPMILARPQMQKIVNEWNELRDFGTSENSTIESYPDHPSDFFSQRAIIFKTPTLASLRKM